MKYRHHLSRQILLGCLAFMLILGILIAVISFRIFEMGMETQYRTRIQDVIDLTLARVDVSDLETCMQTGEPSEGLGSLTAFMDDVRRNCALDYIVICRPVKENDGYDVKAVVSGLLPDERAGESRMDIPVPQLGDSIGEMYPADFIPVIYDDMINRKDIKFSTSHTGFGDSYDGAIAIVNESGEGVALLTAGLSSSAIRSAMRQYGLLIGGGIVVVAAIMLLFMNVWLNKRVIRPLKMIQHTAEDFAAKSKLQTNPDALHLNRPDIHSGDELEALADSIVSLSEDMKAYADNLVRSAVQMETMQREIARANNLANKDALTGVRNKTAFDAKAKELDAEIAAGVAEFGVVMIDLNRLKVINDTYGHEKGDIYLKNACNLICNTFAHSPVYRVGGDEFVVILKDMDFVSRDVLFKRFRQGMRSDSYLSEWECVSAAMGLAIYDPKLDDSLESVLDRADKAMYADKSAMKGE